LEEVAMDADGNETVKDFVKKTEWRFFVLSFFCVDPQGFISIVNTDYMIFDGSFVKIQMFD
jgi:hypothetical protein